MAMAKGILKLQLQLQSSSRVTQFKISHRTALAFASRDGKVGELGAPARLLRGLRMMHTAMHGSCGLWV